MRMTFESSRGKLAVPLPSVRVLSECEEGHRTDDESHPTLLVNPLP
jgi:hypothetical protein